MVKVTSGKGVDGKPCCFYLDGKLKLALEEAKKRNRKNWDYVCCVTGFSGCLSKDTRLHGQEKSIGEIYLSGEKMVLTVSKDFRDNQLRRSISEIIPSGIKEVYEMELENGEKVRATEDHTFFVKDKNRIREVKLRDLKEGQELICIGDCSKIKSIRGVGEEETYDLHTPIYNNFFLENGVLTHNSGKSTWLRGPCKFLDPNFGSHSFAFTADDFIRKTNEFPPYSAVVLDESFESMNAKVAQSKDFMRILNHLQLIRKRRLFIFLCLPNFFDLQKNIAIFRTSHLFIVRAAADGGRGYFSAYDRKRKKVLYIKGSRFLDDMAVKPNFSGRFTTCKDTLDVDEYERMKDQHLLDQDRSLSGEDPNAVGTREWLLRFGFMKLHFDGLISKDRIAEVVGLKVGTVNEWQVFFRRKFPGYKDSRGDED